ncbi:MAG: efflux RND transporter periplasmic adaptor subunit [Oscillatoriales cyanobacterium C42_A2020_001]|nr:efflux RND transporter periplasmic adaptor subunit [Leptolyngbyaceae cyanobacterium C42_A2020_001]
MSGEDTKHSSTVESTVETDSLGSQVADIPETKPPSPKSRRRFLIPAIIVLAVLGGVGWIVFNRIIFPILMFSQMKPQPTFVEISSPQTAAIEDSSDYAANLDSRQSVTLQPRVDGQISAIYVTAGDRVQQGQRLLQIDASEQRAQVASRTAAAETSAAEVEAARADVASASDTLRSLQARRASAQANVQLNQREYERYLDLYNQGAESRQLLDQRLNALQTAQAALRQAEADIQAQRATINRLQATVSRNQRALEQAQANITEGQAQLQFYTISAPFTGIIGNIPAKVGDFVNTSSQLMTLTQNEQLEIQIAIPLERAADLRTGLPVKLLDANNKVLQTGRISFIAPNVDPSTQSVQAKAVFPNPGSFRTSQFVRARVVWDVGRGVLVPTTAISRLGGRDFLFIAVPFKDSGCKEFAAGQGGPPMKPEPNQLTAAQKPIKLGKIVGNNQEVLEGVSASDRIVTSGILQLQNCTPIAEASAAPK